MPQSLALAMWGVLLELAPWLLLGMVIAGVVHVALPPGFVHRQLGGRFGVLKAVAIGVPLPLCSCGVIPAALGLRRDGASPGATVGFLISTPQTGVDSILVSASFLGWPFALFKVAAAAVTGIVGGLVADGVHAGSELTEAAPDGTTAAAPRPRGLRALVEHALEILRTIWGWIVLGVVVSALIELFVPESFFTGLAAVGTLLPILATLAVSLPLYVCATASVPVAAALVAAGMPGGAALVFLMAGPASNVATIGAVYRALGRKALVVYLATIGGGSVLAGLLFDSLLSAETIAVAHRHEHATWWAIASAVVLLALMAWFALDGARGFVARRRPGAGAGAERPAIAVRVGGMTCDGCVAKLERELRATAGVDAVEVRLGRAVVRGSVGAAEVRAAVERAGFAALGRD